MYLTFGSDTNFGLSNLGVFINNSVCFLPLLWEWDLNAPSTNDNGSHALVDERPCGESPSNSETGHRDPSDVKRSTGYATYSFCILLLSSANVLTSKDTVGKPKAKDDIFHTKSDILQTPRAIGIQAGLWTYQNHTYHYPVEPNLVIHPPVSARQMQNSGSIQLIRVGDI